MGRNEHSAIRSRCDRKQELQYANSIRITKKTTWENRTGIFITLWHSLSWLSYYRTYLLFVLLNKYGLCHLMSQIIWETSFWVLLLGHYHVYRCTQYNQQVCTQMFSHIEGNCIIIDRLFHFSWKYRQVEDSVSSETATSIWIDRYLRAPPSHISFNYYLSIHHCQRTSMSSESVDIFYVFCSSQIRSCHVEFSNTNRTYCRPMGLLTNTWNCGLCMGR